MQIWDTAGQDRFKTITQTYYKGAMGVIMTYSITNRESFKNISNWMKQLKQHSREDICKVLVGNKCDMSRVVSTEEGQKLAEEYGMQFFETSAKSGINIQEAFMALGKEIKQKFFDELLKPQPNNVILTPKTKEELEKNKTGCCKS